MPKAKPKKNVKIDWKKLNDDKKTIEDLKKVTVKVKV